MKVILVEIVSYYISCHVLFISEIIKALVYSTWILKIPENSFHFRPLAIFHTQTEIETYQADVSGYQADVMWATDYGNICFHAKRAKMT